MLQELNREAVLLRQGLLQRVDRIETLKASHPHKRLFVLSAAYDLYSVMLDIRQAGKSLLPKVSWCMEHLQAIKVNERQIISTA